MIKLQPHWATNRALVVQDNRVSKMVGRALSIEVKYRVSENDGAVIHKAVALDNIVLPEIRRAVSAHPELCKLINDMLGHTVNPEYYSRYKAILRAARKDSRRRSPHDTPQPGET